MKLLHVFHHRSVFATLLKVFAPCVNLVYLLGSRALHSDMQLAQRHKYGCSLS